MIHPLKTGAHAIGPRNRIVMAPLTRSRANDDTGREVLRYARRILRTRRAGAGYHPSPSGPRSARRQRVHQKRPGIYTNGPGCRMKKVTDAVHAKGGKIVDPAVAWWAGSAMLGYPARMVRTRAPRRPSRRMLKPLPRTVIVPHIRTPCRWKLRRDAHAIVARLCPRDQNGAVRPVLTEFEVHGANGYLLVRSIPENLQQNKTVEDAYGRIGRKPRAPAVSKCWTVSFMRGTRSRRSALVAVFPLRTRSPTIIRKETF